VNAHDKLRVAVLISGSGTNLQAIIDAVNAGDLAINIVAVLSDNPTAYGLQRAEAAGIATDRIDYSAFPDRATYDAALDSRLSELNPQLVVLAGYMRIIADATVNKFKGRMINVHPSLLPAYPGLHTYRRALAANEAVHGTTVHFVIPELDAGPPFLQYRVKIHADETERSLRERVQAGEHIVYPKGIGWIADGRLKLQGNQVWLDNEPLAGPVVIDESETA